jgi:hypothetical protein
MTPARLYRGWVDARREAYRWPAILSRAAQSPGKMVNLAYNILRRGGIYGHDPALDEQDVITGPSISSAERSP